MPNWTELMKRMVIFARAHVTREQERVKLEACDRAVAMGQLVEAAAEVRELLLGVEFSAFLKEQFDRRKLVKAPDGIRKRMSDRIANLVDAPWGGIVTTNFDELIPSDPFDWSLTGDDPDLGHILSRGERFYVRLHSSGWHSRLVLTSEDYYDLYLREATVPTVQPFLRALMLSFHLVFIGCSLEDRILDLRKELHRAFFGRIPPAYALLPATPRNCDRAERLRREYEIRSLIYSVDDDPSSDHFAVDRFLREAANCVRDA